MELNGLLDAVHWLPTVGRRGAAKRDSMSSVRQAPVQWLFQVPVCGTPGICTFLANRHVFALSVLLAGAARDRIPRTIFQTIQLKINTIH
jgi:hypothetical protein